jgi:glyoxylase-like metal-dependent hydrolase (beta-lactamase superfamily II)
VEIPMISASGSIADYRATLAHLGELLSRTETVVPGHGVPIPRAQAETILAEDHAYLEALDEHGEAAELPPGRRTAVQRRIHAENVAARG